MPTKLERLRAGETVEVHPGKKARLNFENKTYETSDGKSIDASNDKDFFPASKEEELYSKKKEEVSADVKNKTFGEFRHQFSHTGVVGGVGDIINRLTKKGDEYLRNKKAHEEVGEEIAERSPWTSGLAKTAEIGGEIAGTWGMGAAKAGATLAGLSSGSRVLDEPGQVAAEILTSAAGGALIERGGRALTRGMTERRALSRSLPERQAAARAGNQERTAAYNAFVDTTNNENRAAQQAYDNAVQQTPMLQKAAQAEHVKNVVTNAKKIESHFPEGAKIPIDDIGVKAFIDENVSKSALAGSKEGSQASKILESLFPEGETLAAKELSKRYTALEGAIERSPQEIKDVLNQFKNHLGERIPTLLEDSIAFKKVVPSLARTIESELIPTLSDVTFTHAGKTEKISQPVKKSIIQNSPNVIKNIKANNFSARLQNGEVIKDIIDELAPIRIFIPGELPGNITAGSKAAKGLAGFDLIGSDIGKKAKAQQKAFTKELTKKMEAKSATFKQESAKASQEASEKLKSIIPETQGIVQPTQLPQKPQMNPLPNRHTDPRFAQEPVPTLPPPQGFSEHAGDFLESNPFAGRGLVDNPITKLAGLKYMLGKAALPLEAGYLGARALTSPTAGGAMARLSFRQAGIQAIEQWAQKYPSYHDGILENPQERRSLTREIEDDAEIPLEQKAIIQSKVNRGKPLDQSF
jgi:hypothetical protein